MSSWFDDPPDEPTDQAGQVRQIDNEPDLEPGPPPTEPPAATNGHAPNGQGPKAPKPAEHPLPHDIETERALLGAALNGAAQILDSTPDDLWYGGGHLHIANAIRAVAEDNGRADITLVVGWLQQRDLLELAGGHVGLAEVNAGAGWPTSADRYLEVLEDHRLARAIVIAADAATRAAKAGNVLEAQDHLARLELRPRARELQHRSLTDTFGRPPAPPTNIVQGLISAGEMTALAAPRALGKTWLGMNLALLAAEGRGKLAGTLDVLTQTNTLYCHGELDPHGAYTRWHRMTLGDPPHGVYETFDRWRIKTVDRRTPVAGGGTDTHIEGLLDPRLEALIVERQIGLVIIDPWAVYFAGKENSNDESEAALDKLRDLALRHGTAVLLLHHISAKIDPGRMAEPEDLWRGATRLADWASTRITMLRHFTDAEVREAQMTRQEARRFVDVKLLRRGEPTPDFSMRMNFGTGWWEAWNPPGRPEGSVDPAKNPDSERIAHLCAAAGGWKSLREAAADLNVGTEKASQLLRRAALDGQLEAIPGARNSTRYMPTVEPVAPPAGSLEELLLAEPDPDPQPPTDQPELLEPPPEEAP